ncbi:MAG: hypothetical protein H3C59_16820 [Burkholderiaceae bacterium]|nr:hypothetical protein [Burkholderiaceae bacterium]
MRRIACPRARRRRGENAPPMIFLRVLVVVLLAAVAYCALGYVFTRERRYLRLAWRLLLGGLVAALVFFAVMFVERLTAPTAAALPGALSARAAVPANQARERLAERRRVGVGAQPVQLAQRR